MVGRRTIWILAAAVLLPLPVAYRWVVPSPTTASNLRDEHARGRKLTSFQFRNLQTSDGMVLLPGGEFLMGSPRPAPDDQRPVHRVRLKPFRVDQTHVTNRQFQLFIEATHYQTTAERRGYSLMFDRQHGRWEEVPQVSWRHPTGANSSLAGKESFPVVHVSWHDAQAYAAWAGKRLLTEAEYEYAARGGLSDTRYPWGRELTAGNQPQANYWQGSFPLTNLVLDGHFEAGPVGEFAPNAFGLFDMVGNVSCWCSDWYAADAYGRAASFTGTSPTEGNERVHRGGSWLSTAERGEGLQVSDRLHADPDETSSVIGFRCARSVDDDR